MMTQQRKRCSYNLSFKLKAFESEEKTSKEAAARQFGVDARRIGKWHSRVAVTTTLAHHAVQRGQSKYDLRRPVPTAV